MPLCKFDSVAAFDQGDNFFRGNVPADNPARQGGFHFVLDNPLERSSPESRVVTFFGQVGNHLIVPFQGQISGGS